MVVVVRHRQAANERRADAVKAFASAWTHGDLDAMYRLTGGPDRPTLAAFRRSYERVRREAGIERVRTGKVGKLRNGAVRVPATVRTAAFGTLDGTVSLPTRDQAGKGRVVWSPRQRLPGLREGESVSVRSGRAPTRGDVLAADGTPLADDPTGAGIAGMPGAGGDPPTGLQRLYDDRLAGQASSTLRFGDRVIRRVKARKGRDVHSTIRLGLTRAAVSALGSRNGGVAVIKPSDGSVLALAGLAVSAPQPPGSTFKIITLSSALQNKAATLASSYPVSTGATLSGVRLANASNESCGGSLAVSFADSCNSVFAPLGAKLGAKKLVATAEKFGFNEQPKVPAAKLSSISKPSELKDDLAVGSAAIGQEKDLATPLQMASVGATIANHGVRIRPRVVREETKRRRRVVSRKVAGEVRDLMIGVVRGGTGTAAALPGITVAGKTGTAELVPTAGGASDPQNTDAWFVAFAPAGDPKIAVAVMLIGAGAGGASAAPVAREVLQAGL